MRRATVLLWVLTIAAFAPPLSVAQTRTSNTLDIYVIDVEGGNATLFVAPSHESLLIDTGNAGAAAARDAGRIMEAIQAAGLQQIDHLITTHWHGDHFGGMAELASKVPIREFIDHGPNVQPGEAPDNFLKNVYPQLQPPAMPIAPAAAPPPGPGAPPAPAHNGTAYWIKVSAQKDGSFTVTNARNGFSKTYQAGL